jgi:hypothetical protein
MNAEERETLEQVKILGEENHEILEKLYRIEKRRRLFRIVYWALIVAFSLGAYYLVQPYLEAFRDLTGADFGSFINVPGFGK